MSCGPCGTRRSLGSPQPSPSQPTAAQPAAASAETPGSHPRHLPGTPGLTPHASPLSRFGGSAAVAATKPVYDDSSPPPLGLLGPVPSSLAGITEATSPPVSLLPLLFRAPHGDLSVLTSCVSPCSEPLKASLDFSRTSSDGDERAGRKGKHSSQGTKARCSRQAGGAPWRALNKHPQTHSRPLWVRSPSGACAGRVGSPLPWEKLH